MARRTLALIAGLLALCVGLSSALIAPTAKAADPFMSVTLTRTDTLGPQVQVGQTLTFSISYTNLSTQAITAFPRSSNLAGVLTNATPNCRWGTLAVGATQGCTSAKHVVTADDVAAGSFTPTVTFDATSDVAGTQVLEAGFTSTVAPITVVDAPVITAAAPTSLAFSSDATITYTLSSTPVNSKLTVTAPAGWQVSPSAQWVSNGTATVTVRAPQTGSSGAIVATVDTPEGLRSSATTNIALVNPAVIPVAGVAAWDSAEITGEGTNGFVARAVDGNTSTYWHTR